MAACDALAKIDRSGRISLLLRGDIDAVTTPAVELYITCCLRLLQRSAARLTIDCSEVSSIDAHGLVMLLHHGRQVRLVNPSPQVLRLLDRL